MIEKIGFENLPNIYFSKIKVVEKDNNHVKVVTYLKVFDDDQNSYWFYSDLFKQRLRIKLSFFDSNENKLFTKMINDFRPNKMINHSAQFDLSKIKGLTVSANLEMDLDNLGFDISWVSDKQWYRGPESREKIFDMNNKQINSMFRFLKGDSVYYGPVHEHSNGYMEGSFHSSRVHQSLQQESEEDNSKITYFDNKIKIPNNSRKNLNYVNPISEIITNVEKEHVQTIFCVSNTNLSLLTFAGQTLASRNLDYFKKMKNKVKIEEINAHPFEEEHLKVSLLENLQSENNGSCQLTDLNLAIEDDVRFYEFRDVTQRSSIGQLKKIKYIVSYRSLIEDNLIKLIDQARDLKSQLDVAIENMSMFYSRDEESFSKKGLIEINFQNSIDFKNNKIVNRDEAILAYWIKIPVLYKELTNFISGNLEDQTLNVYSSLNPLTATLESMHFVSVMLEKTISSIVKIYDLEFDNYNTSRNSSKESTKEEKSFLGNIINYKMPSKIYNYDDLDDLVVKFENYKPDELSQNYPVSFSFINDIMSQKDYSFKSLKSITLSNEEDIDLNQEDIGEAIQQSSKETIDNANSKVLPVFSKILSNRIFNNPLTTDSVGNVEEYVGDNSLFAIPDSTDLLTFVSSLDEEEQKVIINTVLDNKWSGLPLAALGKPPFLNNKLLPNSIMNFYNNQETIQNEEQTSTTSANDWLANSFFNCVEIKYFDGFSLDKNGLYDLGNPQFKTLTKEVFDNLPSNSSLILFKQFADFLNQIISYYYGSSSVLSINDENIKNKINILRKQ